MKVVHCKKESYDVYIGRPSKWGNPFTHLNTNTQAKFKVNSREEAIEAYRKWITEGDGRHLLKDLHELKGKVLGCWCAPKLCHGDILIALVQSLDKKWKPIADEDVEKPNNCTSLEEKIKSWDDGGCSTGLNED